MVKTPEASSTAVRRSRRVLTRPGVVACAVGVGAVMLCWFVPWILVVTHLACLGLGYGLWHLGRRSAAAAPLPEPHRGKMPIDWAPWLNEQPQPEQVLRDLTILAQERAGVCMWSLDLATGVYACDDNMRRILGISGELNLSIATQCIHPEDRDLVGRELTRALKDRDTNDLLTTRHRTVKPDGSISYIETHGRVVRAANGWGIRLQGITRDVTAEVQHAEQLQQQTRQVQVLLDRISVAVKAAGIAAWEMDLHSRQFLWMENPGRALGLGAVPLEQTAAALGRMIEPEDLAETRRIARTAIASGQPTFSYRFRARREGGALRHMQSYAHIVRDHTGRALRLIGATADITNEVQTNELLQRQAEQGQALLERLTMATRAANIGFWEMDLQSQTLSVHDLSDPAIGPESDRAALLSLQALQHPEDRSVFEQAVADAVAAGSDVISYRYRIQDGNGWAHKQNFARLILGPNGTPVRALGLTWDVTREAVAATRLELQAQQERTLLDRLSVVTQTANISSWEIDLTTRQLLWTDNLIKAFCGPDGQAGTVEQFVDRIHPEDRSTLDSSLERALADRSEMLASRHRMISVDGEVTHIQAHFRISYGIDGTPLRLLGAAWDVSTEVDATDRARQQSEERRLLLERFALATQAADISTWELDLPTRRFTWTDSEALGQIIPIGSTLDDFAAKVHPEDKNTLPDALRAAFKEGADKIAYQYRSYEDEGTRLAYWQVKALLYRDERGRVVRMLGMTRDITREVTVAARLEEQAKHERILLDRFTMATQTAKICSWEIDIQARRFLWADNPLVTVNGVQDLSGNVALFLERVHPEDRMAFATLVRDTVIARRDTMSWCYRDTGPGGVAHIQTHARLLYDENGMPANVIGVSWDVTPAIESADKLKQQAQQLHDAQRRLERASLSSSEGHWEADVLQQRLWFSSSFYALLGYQEGELSTDIGGLHHLVHPDDLQSVRVAQQQHLEQGTSFCVDARLRMAGGEYRWFRQRGTAERNAQGQAISMSGSIQDIHQQKLAEDALNLAQLRLERAIKGTQDGLWELESSGAAWCSPRVAELLGYTAEELPSDTDFLRLFLHPDDAQVLADATQLHFEHALPYEAEIRLRTKRGEYRWYRARAAAERDAAGKPQRLSGSLQDVTEARAAREELLQATEAAQAASRAKSEFLANVSHEIRTPMNGIIGMTRLLLDTSLDRTQRDYAGTIRGSADSLLVVINDILDFSKIEAGKLEIEAIEFDLAASVEEVAATLALQAAVKQLELVVDIEPSMAARVVGDPQRVRQCLLNLLGNAVKFTQAGEIVIEVRRVVQGARTLTRFEVRDTGIGIAASTLDTLFQPFVQADSSTTRHFGGTGLGLSIVRRLVEMMGGEVGVVSVVGEGSRFWFQLPLADTGRQPARAESLQSAQRVLLADGNATSQRVLAAQLRHAGYAVELAANGVELLGQLLEAARATRPFAVVLADSQLEGLDAPTLLTRLRAEPSLADCRVVSLVRVGQTEVQLDSAAFAGCLNKPVRQRELAKCLQRALTHRSGDWHLQTQSLLKRPSASQAVRFAGRVLLVEDNPVNQKVAMRFLERLGCEVVVADNGANGVRAYREARYDLVLMDLQMPIMDGLTATGRIRELETEARRTPIVALTANAMPEQQRLCAQAGMDGFLTKPLELARLQEMLEKHGLGRPVTADVDHTATSGGAPCDLARLHELTAGDLQFTQELTASFSASGTQMLRELQQAVVAADRGQLVRSAHQFKGAAANVHASQLATLAHALETQSDASLEHLSALVEQLGQEFLRTTRYLEQHLAAGLARAG